jgi:hypothetical protein
MNRLALSLPFLALVLGVLAPDAAHATDFCVAPNTTCGGTNVPTLPAALAAADNSVTSDRVFLGDATYTAPTATGFDYNAPAFPVEIVGAGADKSKLTGPAGASRVLRFQGGPGSSIHDLGVVLPQNVAFGAIGLDLADPALRLTVTAHPTQANTHRGIVLRDGASIADATIALSQDFGNLVGIVVDAPSASVARSTIVARTGVEVSVGASATVDRITATSSAAAVEVVGGTVTVTSSVLRPVSHGAGLVALDQPGDPGSVSADGVTIMGDGSGESIGALADEFQGNTATVTIENSIIRGVESSLVRYGGAGTANLTARFSDFDPDTSEQGAAAGTLTPPIGALEPGGNVNVDPQFGDPSLHLLASSPLVDAGDPATAAGFDFDGNPLLVDGNGDGMARRDIGAFERPVPTPAPPGGPGGGDPPVAPLPALVADVVAPRLSGLRVGPGRVRAGRTARLDVTLDEPATLRVTLQRVARGRREGRACRRPSRRNRAGKPCTRYVRVAGVVATVAAGPQSVRLPARPGGRALRRGKHRASVTATDAAGNRSAPATVAFTVRRR